MAWRRPGNKPLSEPMMVGLLMHLCHSALLSKDNMFEKSGRLELQCNTDSLSSIKVKCNITTYSSAKTRLEHGTIMKHKPWALSQYKDCLSRYGDSHYKDKTVMRTLCHSRNPYTVMMVPFPWNRTQTSLFIDCLNITRNHYCWWLPLILCDDKSVSRMTCLFTGGFPSQRASITEGFSVLRRHHVDICFLCCGRWYIVRNTLYHIAYTYILNVCLYRS